MVGGGFDGDGATAVGQHVFADIALHHPGSARLIGDGRRRRGERQRDAS